MATVTLALVAFLALVVFLLLGAVIELFGDVQQLREAIGILDRPLDVALGDIAGASPSRYGLPRGLDDEAFAVVLFLHDSCGTCRSLAAALDGRVPEGLWIVMEARSHEVATQFLHRYGLSEGASPRVVIDEGQRSADLLGLDIASVALRVQNGTIVSASTVPSTRYLGSILPSPLRLKRTDPAGRSRSIAQACAGRASLECSPSRAPAYYWGGGPSTSKTTEEP
jgi:hypothetical protein